MVRAVALALTVLTGFSGLVYEVAWQKYLATLLGSHSEATAAVLALFLGGLSLGYALFGRVTRAVVNRGVARGEPPPLLLLYGVVEAGIGVHALLFPVLFRGVRALSFAIPHQVGGPGFALDVALAALLILPPTVLMGGTIPILTQALARSLADATRFHALVYGFNTAGAFAGALAAGFVLVPWLGLERVVWAMGAINLTAGAAFVVLGTTRRGALSVSHEEGHAALPLGVYGVAALLIGFAAMDFQTVLIRLGGLSLGSSQFTFSMVVAVFVLCIALGSFAVSALPRIPAGLLVASQWALAGLMLLLYPALQNAPYWAHVVRSLFRDDDAAFYPYHLAVFLGVLVVLAVPVGLSGATLPLLFHHLRREFGDLGSAAGRLYAWNTVGSLLGALLGGYVLFFWLNLDQVYVVGTAAVLISATLLSVRLLELPRATTLGLVLVPALLGIALLPAWHKERLNSGLFRLRQPQAPTYAGPDTFFSQYRTAMRLLFYEDDPNNSVAVEESTFPDGARDVTIFTNGKADGSIRIDYPTMALAAILPALFARQAETAFVIGYGTGVTVGELAALDSIRKVTVAEISPGVIKAGHFFEPSNQGALANPKTEVIISDAYRALLRTDQRYDVIASEPSNPWVTGVEMLFSQEFLRAARDRLRPGGVYAQWFHLYETDTSVVELVWRTYASVFDHVAVWYTLSSDILLLGFESAPDLDPESLRRHAARPEMRRALARARIESFPELLAHELLPLDVVGAAGFEGDVHRIFHPILSYEAARAFFRGGQTALPRTLRPPAATVGARNSLFGRWLQRWGGQLSDLEWSEIAGETCEHMPLQCATVLARWLRDLPKSPARENLLARLRSNSRLRPYIAPRRLGLLAHLLSPPQASDAPVDVALARQATDLFVSHYHHALPFDRDALAALWNRCQGDACAPGRAIAEEWVGPLAPSIGLRSHLPSALPPGGT